jgi:glutamine synthetase
VLIAPLFVAGTGYLGVSAGILSTLLAVRVRRVLGLEELKRGVDDGSIDTVVLAFTDMQGRLMGKRLQGEFFVEEGIGERGVEACNYLLALDMEMDPVPGYALANWEQGYGDFGLVPDPGTLRRIPWLDGTALMLCDVTWHDGTPVAPSPRQVLKGQVERARALGFEPMFGSELEFYLFKETYAEAHAKRYEGLTPSVPYILDYHVLATSYDEPFIRQIRKGMQAAGIPVENSKGEAWPGQHEINFRFADAVTMADNHTIYKNGAKELAHLNGCSITFMAKPDHTWIGNSCHIHSSLRQGGENAFAGESELFRRYLAGQIACLKELAIFVAPTVNSYKRFAAGSWAPTTLAWGHDNRTCGFRIVGHGGSVRTETRIPGGDVNPYLAFAALLAAGLYGIEHELELPPPLEGNAYESDAERFPGSLRDAITTLEEGTMARAAFGDDVVDHYLNYARTEQRLFDQVVTGYERERMFERG